MKNHINLDCRYLSIGSEINLFSKKEINIVESTIPIGFFKNVNGSTPQIVATRICEI